MTDHKASRQNEQTDYAGVRRWKRYPVALSLRARVPTNSGLEYMLASGRDISQGGMALHIEVELELGQSILLQLTFPDLQQPMSLLATVKNRVGFKYGVEFVRPTPYQQEIILGNLEKLLALSKSDHDQNPTTDDTD